MSRPEHLSLLERMHEIIPTTKEWQAEVSEEELENKEIQYYERQVAEVVYKNLIGKMQMFDRNNSNYNEVL